MSAASCMSCTCEWYRQLVDRAHSLLACWLACVSTLALHACEREQYHISAHWFMPPVLNAALLLLLLLPLQGAQGSVCSCVPPAAAEQATHSSHWCRWRCCQRCCCDSHTHSHAGGHA
jgi:hypothetical protein